MPTEILIATSNDGKTREIKRALRGLPLTILTLHDFPFVRVVEEIGASYEENAISKALGYAAQTGIYALADDSGLEVNALDGGPGFLSALYGRTGLSDVERSQKLLSSLAHTDIHGRGARFVSVAALAQPFPNQNVARVRALTKGSCEGVIALTSRGEHGFGYDSIFVPNGYSETFGELADSIKNRISHRAQSMMQMRIVLKRVLEKT